MIQAIKEQQHLLLKIAQATKIDHNLLILDNEYPWVWVTSAKGEPDQTYCCLEMDYKETTITITRIDKETTTNIELADPQMIKKLDQALDQMVNPPDTIPQTMAESVTQFINLADKECRIEKMKGQT